MPRHSKGRRSRPDDTHIVDADTDTVLIALSYAIVALDELPPVYPAEVPGEMLGLLARLSDLSGDDPHYHLGQAEAHFRWGSKRAALAGNDATAAHH